MKPVLRKGSRDKAVEQLQKLLNQHDKKLNLKIDGDFGPATEKAVKQFQKIAGLVADGVVGNKTWHALAQITVEKTRTPRLTPQAPLAEIAAQYLGVTETGNNLAGDSEALLAIFKADDLTINGKTDGYPWCAAFVSFCVQKLVKRSPYFSTIIAPREASVNRFLTIWAKNNSCLIFPANSKAFSPQKGDIVVFKFSHIGIVENVNGNTVTTIEGNTNDAGSREGKLVARKNRSKSIIKSFIRLPITTIKLNSRLDELSRYC
ncbi:peptidoglycan-binding protein [Aliikangiella maris]|uniref:Peptidoglycan-binding protein n=2 Tax=Aliikangiella maris TaxID=3162458 RepID=A0ABV3MST4_9GAMM